MDQYLIVGLLWITYVPVVKQSNRLKLSKICLLCKFSIVSMTSKKIENKRNEFFLYLLWGMNHDCLGKLGKICRLQQEIKKLETDKEGRYESTRKFWKLYGKRFPGKQSWLYCFIMQYTQGKNRKNMDLDCNIVCFSLP